MKPCSEFKTTKDFLQQSAFKKPIKKTKEPEEYIKKHRWHKHTFDCGQCGMQILDCEVCNVLYCPGCDEKITCKQLSYYLLAFQVYYITCTKIIVI